MFCKIALKLWWSLPMILLIIITMTASNGRAQSNRALFDSTWYGFNSGTFTNGRYPVAAGMADVDNDGDLDVMVAKSTWSNGLTLLRNEGDGFFAQPERPKTSTAIFI